jgi:type II secretory pathway component PulK
MFQNQRGSALLLAIIVFAVMFAVLGLTLEQGASLARDVRQKGQEEAALQLAEGGVELACQQLIANPVEFVRKQEMMLETGSISIEITQIAPSGTLEIFSKGTLSKSSGQSAVQKAVRVLLSLDREQKNIIVHQWEEAL